MSPHSTVRFVGAELRHSTEPELPTPPGVFLADPPENLSGVTTGPFLEAEAKSPHGISRTGVVPLIVSVPPARHRVSRRPVVALVDTAIGDHPWLGPTAVDGEEPSPFWRTAVFTPSDPPGDLGKSGPTTRAYGHGTFIAGIIRQLAPNANVLSFPVMSDTGHATTRSVLQALNWLLAWVMKAHHEGRSEYFVDVINLSFGWYRGKEDAGFPAAEYRKVLDDLGNAGVRVVASAGNRSVSTPVYPAAFAREQVESPNGPRTSLVSVGALDPDGKLAAYSNTGDWVRLLAPGTGLISTVPPAAGVPWQRSIDHRGNQLPNPNHLARGFARWGGTSFAAAWVSARIAAHLLDEPHGSRLDDLDPDAVHERAAAALNAAEADIDDWLRWCSA